VSRARQIGVSGAVLCAVAALFAAPELYVPGLALLLAATVAPAWVILAARGAEVKLNVNAATLSEGEPLQLTVRVSRGWLPFPGCAFTPWPGWELSARPIGRDDQSTVAAIASHRGLQRIGPATVRISDPFGICTREVSSPALELLVLPRVYPVRLPARRRLAGQTRSLREAALEFDSLRPYVAGTPASRIHWPTVARTGALIERRLAPEADPRILVVLDAYRPQSEEALDEALRATASLCLHFAELGGCLLMLPDDQRPSVLGPDLIGWPSLHARLALIGPGAQPRREVYLNRGRTVVYVTASAAGGRGLTGRGWRVSPCPVPGRAVAFAVAGCSGQSYSEGVQAGAA
jgi:uncharacterized protein (DUF58 family)